MSLSEHAWLERFNGRTCVYRAFDADGKILYVGIAWSWPRRWMGHADGLMAQVAQLQVTWHDTRQQALAIEADLIRRLRPPYNAAPHNQVDQPASRRYGYDRFIDDRPLAEPPGDLSRDATLTIREAAAALGLESKTIRNLLSEFKRDFGPKTYAKHPRGYQLRLLSEADIYLLRAIITRWMEAEAARPSREK